MERGLFGVLIIDVSFFPPTFVNVVVWPFFWLQLLKMTRHTMLDILQLLNGAAVLMILVRCGPSVSVIGTLLILSHMHRHKGGENLLRWVTDCWVTVTELLLSLQKSGCLQTNITVNEKQEWRAAWLGTCVKSGWLMRLTESSSSRQANTGLFCCYYNPLIRRIQADSWNSVLNAQPRC